MTDALIWHVDQFTIPSGGEAMIDPRVLVILAILAGGYWVGEQAVAGIKKVDRAVAHVVAGAGKKLAHVFHHPDKEAPSP